MEKANLQQYLPSIYEGMKETDALTNTENEMFDTLALEIKKVKDNQYILTCDLRTIAEYEKIFKIIDNAAVEDEEFRRNRIINRVSTKPPFHLHYLYGKLDTIIGKDKYNILMDYDNYTLYVESGVTNQMWYRETVRTINHIKPANIFYIQVPRLLEEIAFEEKAYISNLEYLRLNEWRLGISPFLKEGNAKEVNLL